MSRAFQARGRFGFVAALVAAPLAANGQTLDQVLSGCGGVAPEATVLAGPSDYLTVLATLTPGVRLLLDPGTYTGGLPVQNLVGEANRCIVIEGPGPATGPPAVFLGRDCCNTVSIRDSSFVAIRNLELDGLGLLGDGVKAEFDSSYAHHITLENLYIHGHGADQQIVGINTKSIVWNWVIRRNVIEGAGTSCPSNGTGNDLSTGVTVNIESGRSVSFSLETPVLSSAYGMLVNLASVAPPAGTSDPDTSNNSDADIDGVPGACGFPTHLELVDQSVSATDSFEVCLSLAVGQNFQIVAPGRATFRAGERIVFKSGFSVLPGGELAAEIDPALSGN